MPDQNIVNQYRQGAADWILGKAKGVQQFFSNPPGNNKGGPVTYPIPDPPPDGFTLGDVDQLASLPPSLQSIFTKATQAEAVSASGLLETERVHTVASATQDAVDAVSVQLMLTPDQTVDDLLAHAEWPYSEGQTFAQGASATFVGGTVMRQYGLMRSFANANFWINVEDLDTEGNPPTILTFAGMDPSSKLNMNETDYQMAVRLYPAYTWVANFGGGPFLGANVIGMDGGVTNYIYAPRSPTLQEFYHLWDYTPPSGPPVRNAISDFISVLTLLPIQY